MNATTKGKRSLRQQLAVLAEFNAAERATRPAGVVTPGAGSDLPRVQALRERFGIAQPAQADDFADLIDD